MSKNKNLTYVGKAHTPKPKKRKPKQTQKKKAPQQQNAKAQNKKEFPKEFPFWARLKISKNRTTLVIDEVITTNSKTNKLEDMFVHREATHSYKKEFDKISPNPDTSDKKPMYLKRPTKKPKRLFEPHNKKLLMPQSLKERYGKNNLK